MNHLAVPAYCALVACFCLALLLRAVSTDAYTFVLIFLAAFLYFAWRTCVDIRKNWPAFKAEMRRRTEARRRDAQQKRHPYTDIH